MKEYQVTYKFSDIIRTVEAVNSDEALKLANNLLQSEDSPQIDTACYDLEIEEIN